MVADKSVNEPAAGVVAPITEPSTEPPEIDILLIVDVPLTIKLLTVVSPDTLSVPLKSALTPSKSAESVVFPVTPRVPPTVAAPVTAAVAPLIEPLAVILVPLIVEVDVIAPELNVPPNVVFPVTPRVPPTVVSPDVSATEKLSIDNPPPRVTSPVTPRVPPTVELLVIAIESTSAAPATLNVPLISASETTDKPVPDALLNVSVSEISAVLLISTAPVNVAPPVTLRLLRVANPDVPTVVKRAVDAVLAPIVEFSIEPPDIAIALIVEVPVTFILVNVALPVTSNVPPTVALLVTAILSDVTALLLTTLVNTPVDGVLAPIGVASISPPPISTLGNVAVPETVNPELAEIVVKAPVDSVVAPIGVPSIVPPVISTFGNVATPVTRAVPNISNLC